jgi:hypothetical protein
MTLLEGKINEKKNADFRTFSFTFSAKCGIIIQAEEANQQPTRWGGEEKLPTPTQGNLPR